MRARKGGGVAARDGSRGLSFAAAMKPDPIRRHRPWLAHFFGENAMPGRRLFRLAFRDIVVEATLQLAAKPGFGFVLKRWLESREWRRWRSDYEARCVRGERDSDAYRVPADLARTEVPLRRTLLIGSCLSERLAPES